jgi:hypothetical protein
MGFTSSLNNWKAYTIFIIVALTALYYVKKWNKSEILKIYSNSSFAIGTVTNYSSTTSHVMIPKLGTYRQVRCVRYTFIVCNEIIERGYEDSVLHKIPDLNVSVGDKYIVIYHRDDPQKNIMLFDYPIKDSADFNLFLKNVKDRKIKLKPF